MKPDKLRVKFWLAAMLGPAMLLEFFVFPNFAFATLPLLPSSASSSSSYEGVRTEVYGYAMLPTVQAFFERMDKTNDVQDCMFEQLIGDASSSDVAAWNITVSGVNPSQWSKRQPILDSTFGNCLRTDYVDSLGLVKESCWNDSNTGFLVVAAAFDSAGHVLDLVRYLNVRALNFIPKHPLNCDQTKFHSLPISIGRPGGTVELQAFVQVCDETTLWTLTQNFGLSASASHPGSASGDFAGANSTSIPTLEPTSLPTVVPAPLPTLRPASIPTAVPTLAPTISPTPNSARPNGPIKIH